MNRKMDASEKLFSRRLRAARAGAERYWSIKSDDAANPTHSKTTPWPVLNGLGNRGILRRSCLGLICSVQCPGSVVIKTFDAIRELRDAGIPVVGGFHSPMEKECLDFLLRGEQPVIVVLAKGLGRPRLTESWLTALDADRLLVLAPFGDGVRRITKAHAHCRNEFIAAHATAVLIPHASPGGKAEAIARTVLEHGKTLFTFEDERNQYLLQLGATRFGIAETVRTIQNDSSNNRT